MAVNGESPRITALTAEDAKDAEKDTASAGERKDIRYELGFAVLGVLGVG